MSNNNMSMISSISGSSLGNNLISGPSTAPQLTLDQLDQRLTVVETLLAAQSQLASNSFASQGSLHLSDFGTGNGNNQPLNGTVPLGFAVTGTTNAEHNGSCLLYTSDAADE